MLPPRVILLAPASGESGVGDHTDLLVEALRPHLDVLDLRHGTVLDDSIGDLRAYRRRVHDAVASSPPGTVVHAEVTGGGAQAFWAMRGLPNRRTVTMHDAPRPFWLPFLSRGVARRRLLRAALLRGLSPLSLTLERRWMRDVDVVALSAAGADAVRGLGVGRDVVVSRLLIPKRSAIAPVWERPAAVGLFGHVYRGKGFDLIPELRRLLPDHVTLRVAGRGTESLPSTPGVEFAGPVDGSARDAWFASVRTILLPYVRAPIGGIRALAASAVQAEAAAYETPCIALSSPTMVELAAEGGCEVVASVDHLAVGATLFATDDAEVRKEHERLLRFRAERSTAATIDAYLRMWDR